MEGVESTEKGRNGSSCGKGFVNPRRPVTPSRVERDVDVRSLGYRTDLLFLRAGGIVEDRGDCLVVRTPSNPTFYWGNFLLFDAPPGAGDFERWRGLFVKEFPEAAHVAFGWDDPAGEAGEIGPFQEAGFEFDDSVVLTARAVRPPPKACAEATVRPLRENWEWAAALENHVAIHGEEHGEAAYRTFAARRQTEHRRLVEAGRGRWFGAFVDDRLAGDLGQFAFEGVGRFQAVGTHPEFRRRGVCGALVHEAARYGLERMGIETLVMVADAHYHAAAIYESVGFAPTERQAGLTRRPH